MKLVRSLLITMLTALLCLVLAGCGSGSSAAAKKSRMSDAELGLTTEQAAGRRVYNLHCLVCHEAYSTSARNGPALAGFYKKQFMVSGLPVNDDRVRDIVTMGKSKMPAFGGQLSGDEVAALIAYMKTL